MEKENIEFSNEEKCKYFDEIVKHFYQKNNFFMKSLL